MRGNLKGIRSRVERLGQAFRSACTGEHCRCAIFHVREDEPGPEWPAPGAPVACGCGERIQYRRVIHAHEPAAPVGATGLKA
jgi:hypothetical protein